MLALALLELPLLIAELALVPAPPELNCEAPPAIDTFMELGADPGPLEVDCDAPPAIDVPVEPGAALPALT